jgi:hypothetical protein
MRYDDIMSFILFNPVHIATNNTIHQPYTHTIHTDPLILT